MNAATNLHEYSVSELSGALKNTIEENYSLVRVRGELGRVVRAGSGHVYLDLKDERAVINGVIWKGMAARLKIDPEQGMEVVATGRMTTFAGQSRYQIVIDTLEPAGVGALMALYEERKKKLSTEGLFAEERKKALPFLPNVIGVVTSPAGAVIRDILHRLRERFPVHVLVWPTLVQGKEAEKQIVNAIEGFNALSPEGPVPRPDVLIVARGGGSLEDLWCFNEESVARSAAASEIPLISAVGHETDTTLIDYVADRRAPTPTAAAEFATPVRTELISEILNKERRMVDAQVRLMETARSGLLAAARGLGRPEDILGTNSQRVDRLADRLAASLRTRLEIATGAYHRASSRLQPSVLSAGFEMRSGRVAQNAVGLRNAMRRIIERRQDHITAVKLKSASLFNTIQSHQQTLMQMKTRLHSGLERNLDKKQQQIGALEKLLSSLSHHNVLARGFALVRDEAGLLMRSVKTVKPGTSGSIELQDGARAVTFGDAGDSLYGEKRQPAKKTIRKLMPKAGSDKQKSLFD